MAAFDGGGQGTKTSSEGAVTWFVSILQLTEASTWHMAKQELPQPHGSHVSIGERTWPRCCTVAKIKPSALFPQLCPHWCVNDISEEQRNQGSAGAVRRVYDDVRLLSITAGSG